MSTLQVSTAQITTLSDGTNSTSCTNAIQGSAKAWVNFNGTTSPGTIRASYNVSSVTKNGTGDYTVNFTSTLTDTNYSAVATLENVINGAAISAFTPSGRTSSSIRCYSYSTAGSVSDTPSYNVSIFR